MSDGAHLHVPAESAMRTIVGDPTAAEPEPMTALQFEDMIRTADLDFDLDAEDSYNLGSNATARLVLEAYERYPQLRDFADETMYLETVQGTVDWEARPGGGAIPLNRTLYDVIKDLNPQHYDRIFSNLTGFMWGWAVNAARSILGLGPLPNPAILTISVPDEGTGVTAEELLGDYPGAWKE